MAVAVAIPPSQYSKGSSIGIGAEGFSSLIV